MENTNETGNRPKCADGFSVISLEEANCFNLRFNWEENINKVIMESDGDHLVQKTRMVQLSGSANS